jgi:shikimate kinase
LSKGDNLILIGFMGSGKSSVAAHLSADFLDTDKMIEAKEGLAISDIFSKHGESYFREIEHDVCASLSAYSKRIISTGGGMPWFFNNSELLKKAGYVVYLESSLDVISRRLSGDVSRPLLLDAERLLDVRRPIYESVCDFSVCTDDLSVAEVAQAIWSAYTSYYGIS